MFHADHTDRSAVHQGMSDEAPIGQPASVVDQFLDGAIQSKINSSPRVQLGQCRADVRPELALHQGLLRPDQCHPMPEPAYGRGQLASQHTQRRR